MSSDLWMYLSKLSTPAILAALAAALVSLVLMFLRWRTPRRRTHAVHALLAVLAIPCLAAMHYAIVFKGYLPALGREQMAESEARRAIELSESSLVHAGEPVPYFTVTDADGSAHSTTEAREIVLLINFFATWCGPCLLELPHMQEIWNEHREAKNFAMLVIGREESLESVREFRDKYGYGFPIAPDPDGEVYSLFAKEYIPRTIVVADGVIVSSTMGFYESDLEQLRALLREQLARVNQAR